MVVTVLVVAALVLAFWLVRLQGQHDPHPMPYWLEGIFLDNPLRRVVFGPDFVTGLLDVTGGERVAEVGSGIGFISAALGRAVGDGGEVFALDQNPRAVRATERRLRGQPASATVTRGDATRLPWAPASLDAVAMVAMLGELPENRRVGALVEVRRVLRPGGRLVIVEYWPDPHYLTTRTLVRYLDQAGFTVARRERRFLQHGLLARPAYRGRDEG